MSGTNCSRLRIKLRRGKAGQDAEVGVLPRFEDRLPIDKVSQKEVTVAIRAAAQRFAIIYNIIRLNEWGHIDCGCRIVDDRGSR